MIAAPLFAFLLAQVVTPDTASDRAPADQKAAPATSPTAPNAQPQPDVPEGSDIRVRKRPAPAGSKTNQYLLPDGETVDANDIMDEMLDELAADVAKLSAARIGPILLERVRLSDNLNPDFAPVVEARLAASISRAAEVALVRCAECWTTRGRLEGAAWVVSRGVNRRDEMLAVANKYSARTLMTVALTLVEEPSTLAMDVELVRADDASIVFAEQYRMNPDTALLYRGVDRTQSRFARLKELQDRIDQRPRFSHAIEMGAMGVPISGAGFAWGAVGRYALTEQFGEAGAGEAGIEAGGYVNTTTFSAGLVGAMMRVRVSPAQLFGSEWRLVFHTGGLLTGGATSFYAGAGLRVKPAVRVTVFALVDYIGSFDIRKITTTGQPQVTTYGGSIAPQLGLGFTWP
jgi:hypothetical protein